MTKSSIKLIVLSIITALTWYLAGWDTWPVPMVAAFGVFCLDNLVKQLRRFLSGY